MKTARSPKLSLGIIGFGVVGQALAHGFQKYPISIYDKYKPSDSLVEVVNRSDILFLCLPTPVFAEGGMDLRIIEETVSEISQMVDKLNDKVIVIKSTVIPGTTKKLAQQYPHLRFAFNPEFLTEKHFLDDFIHADRTIIGADDPAVAAQVAEAYRLQFPDTPIFITKSTEAEMVKLMCNTFLATKVIFANEIFDLCEKLEIDYKEIKKMAVTDKRIYDSHLDITAERGFGGKCFPKDLQSLLALGEELGVDMSLLRKVWEKNLQVRKVKDWESIPFAVTTKDEEVVA